MSSFRNRMGCQNCENPKTKKIHKQSSGFTLIELMIAISIFSFILLYVSQLMRTEINMYTNASQQNDLEQNTRLAMMHILDEMRLHPNKDYSSPDRVIYSPDAADICLLYIGPSENFDLTDPQKPMLTDGIQMIIYLYNGDLWYRDETNPDNPDQKIADQISIALNEDLANLLRIEVTANDAQPNEFKLVTYSRLQ